MKKINIVSVWTWFCNVLDTQTLSASEQLILVHLIKIFNRNFWKPAKISTSAICRSSGKDSRTVKRSISLLISNGFLKDTAEGLFLNFGDEEREQRRGAKQKQPSSSQKKETPKPSALPEFETTEEIERKLERDKTFEKLAKEIEEGNLSDLHKAMLNSMPQNLKDKLLEMYK